MDATAKTAENQVECIAVFPFVKHAAEFAARIAEPGWHATNVARKGRTVAWTGVGFRDGVSVYLLDMLETVGYYGSTQTRKATLNGRPAPVAY